MAEQSEQIHLVSKSDSSVHKTITVPSTECVTELPPNTVSVRSKLLALTANNLSYALGGSVPGLQWWDTYPIPRSVSTTFPEITSKDWGIVPAWGYCTVIASSIPSIKRGSELYGFVPTCSAPVDLQLCPSPDGLTGNWLELSKHREGLMNLYNRYVLQPLPSFEGSLAETGKIEQQRAVTSLYQPVGQAGYLLNTVTFSQNPDPPIHPLGTQHWTQGDADLREAVLIILGAASKTAQSLSWQMSNNRNTEKLGPTGMVLVSSSPTFVKNVQKINDRMPTTFTSYTDVLSGSILSWVANKAPVKVVVIDCGAPEHVTAELVFRLSTLTNDTKRVKTTLIGVGNEMKAYSTTELQQRIETAKKTCRIQFNASGVKDSAIFQQGALAYQKNFEESWEKYIRDSGLDNEKLVWESGVEGIDRVWKGLCEGAQAVKAGVVVRL
ncbi:hypothetical protein FH972_026887 [Carpinus fangiana]|uniref:Uncharacterized protein n=1 Tax=Carpinus fangiana TaxID=176857 RepID=A0A5N6L5C9_9ROSI|nr:hypothetical protein FH972_026887 [Carpinus fangiana]